MPIIEEIYDDPPTPSPPPRAPRPTAAAAAPPQTPPTTALPIGPTKPPPNPNAPFTDPEKFLSDLARTPLFMQAPDPATMGADAASAENDMIEALKALAYEGEPDEVAQNFRNQGNECFRAKGYRDAIEFYGKAVLVVEGERRKLWEEGRVRHRSAEDERVRRWAEERKRVVKEGGDGKEVGLEEVVRLTKEELETKVRSVDVEKKLRDIEEACLANRAQCNLELKNYRKVLNDCAQVLRLNPANIKAYYRSTLALISLQKYLEAQDSLSLGLAKAPENAPLLALQKKLDVLLKAQRDAEEKAQAEKLLKEKKKYTLKLALRERGIRARMTDQPPELEDAEIRLEDPLDSKSTLSFPAVVLYPCHLQSDFVKAFDESLTCEDVIGGMVLAEPLGWEGGEEYRDWKKLEVYMETRTGGLVKVGKKVPLGDVLGGTDGKLEVVDQLVKFFVIPRGRRDEWIEDWKKKRMLKGR
ncbi:TPR domain-containing protein [Peziza echinospora]|nr:TPR domain-containing protein [Peziza echinospora]